MEFVTMAKSTQEELKDHLTGKPNVSKNAIYDDETGEVLAEPDNIETMEGTSDPMQVISKITIATVGGNPAAAKAENRRIPICAIYGKATDVKMVEDPTRKGPDGQTKEWKALAGAFQAVNLQNGQEFMSGVLYLPDAFQTMALTLVEKQNESRTRRGMAHFQGVEFAYQIDAIPAKNPSGYSYVLRSLLPPRKADPLAALRARALDEVASVMPKALPAPAAA